MLSTGVRIRMPAWVTSNRSSVPSTTDVYKRQAQERAHLLEGLLVAQDNIDEVIKIIRSSYDNAKENLMSLSLIHI